ncbi:MAG: hypothetical protein V4501_12680 [Pseudomonadota bacterium]
MPKKKKFLSRKIANAVIKKSANDAAEPNPRTSFPAVLFTFLDAPELLTTAGSPKPITIFDSLKGPLENLQLIFPEQPSTRLREEIIDKLQTAAVNLYDQLNDYNDLKTNGKDIVDPILRRINSRLKELLTIGMTTKELKAAEKDINAFIQSPDSLSQLMAVYEKFHEIRNKFELADLATHFKNVDKINLTPEEQAAREKVADTEMDAFDSKLFGFDRAALRKPESKTATSQPKTQAEPVDLERSKRLSDRQRELFGEPEDKQASTPVTPAVKSNAAERPNIQNIIRGRFGETLKQRAAQAAEEKKAAEKLRQEAKEAELKQTREQVAQARTQQSAQVTPIPREGVPLKSAGAEPQQTGNRVINILGKNEEPPPPVQLNNFTKQPINSPPGTPPSPAQRTVSQPVSPASSSSDSTTERLFTRSAPITEKVSKPEPAEEGDFGLNNLFAEDNASATPTSPQSSTTGTVSPLSPGITDRVNQLRNAEPASVAAAKEMKTAALADAQQVIAQREAKIANDAKEEAAARAAQQANEPTAQQAINNAAPTAPAVTPVPNDATRAEIAKVFAALQARVAQREQKASQQQSDIPDAPPLTTGDSVANRINQFQNAAKPSDDNAKKAKQSMQDELQQVTQARIDKRAADELRRQQLAAETAAAKPRKDTKPAAKLNQNQEASASENNLRKMKEDMQAELKRVTDARAALREAKELKAQQLAAELEENKEEKSSTPAISQEAIVLEEVKNEELIEKQGGEPVNVSPQTIVLEEAESLEISEENSEVKEERKEEEKSSTPAISQEAIVLEEVKNEELIEKQGGEPVNVSPQTIVLEEAESLEIFEENADEEEKKEEDDLVLNNESEEKEEDMGLNNLFAETYEAKVDVPSESKVAANESSSILTPPVSHTSTITPPVSPTSTVQAPTTTAINPVVTPTLLKNWDADLINDILILARAANDSTALSRTKSQLEHLKLKATEFQNANFDNLVDREKLKAQWLSSIESLTQKIAENTARIIVSKDNLPNAINYLQHNKKSWSNWSNTREAISLLKQSEANVTTYDQMWTQLESIKQSFTATSQADYTNRIRFTASKIVKFDVDPTNPERTKTDFDKHYADICQKMGMENVDGAMLALTTRHREEEKVDVRNEMVIMALKGADADSNTVFSVGPLGRFGDIALNLHQLPQNLSPAETMLLAKEMVENTKNASGGLTIQIEPALPPALKMAVKLYCDAKIKETNDPAIQRRYDYFDRIDIEGHLHKQQLKKFTLNPVKLLEKFMVSRQTAQTINTLKKLDAVNDPQKFKGDVDYGTQRKLDNIYVKSERDNKNTEKLQRSLNKAGSKLQKIKSTDIQPEIDKQVTLGPSTKRGRSS